MPALWITAFIRPIAFTCSAARCRPTGGPRAARPPCCVTVGCPALRDIREGLGACRHLGSEYSGTVHADGPDTAARPVGLPQQRPSPWWRGFVTRSRLDRTPLESGSRLCRKQAARCCARLFPGAEKSPVAGEVSQSDPYRGASNLAGCGGSEPVKPRNRPPAWNGLRECWECRAGGHSAKANVGIEALENIDVRTPRGWRGRHARKECAVKARNHSRVA